MDAVAYRTRARCRKAAPERASRQCNTRTRTQSQLGCSGRKRLRKSFASDSQHEEVNTIYMPVPDGEDDHDDSVASNEIRNHDSGSQRRAAGVLKRKRCVVSSPSASSTSSDSDVVIVGEFQSKDCDVVVFSEPARSARLAPAAIPVKKSSSEDNMDDVLGEDEDVRIVGMVGQVVTRDLPHSRPDCAEYRFAMESPVAESNCKCCSQCYCYVCDVKASECKFWGTGLRERDHANARPHAAWNVLRQAARTGDKARVKREFKEPGPLRMPVPSPPAPGSAVALLQEMLAQMEQQVRQLGCNFQSQQQQHQHQHQQRQIHSSRGGAYSSRDLAGSSHDMSVDADVDTFLAAIARLGGDVAVNDSNPPLPVRAEGGAGGRHAARRRQEQEQQQQQIGVASLPAVTVGAARQHQAPSPAPCRGQTATSTVTAAAFGSAGGLRGLQPAASSPRAVARVQQPNIRANTTAGDNSNIFAADNAAAALAAAVVASASHAPLSQTYLHPQAHTQTTQAQYAPYGYPQQLSMLPPPPLQVQPVIPQPMGIFPLEAILPQQQLYLQQQVQPVQIELLQPVAFQPYQAWVPSSATYELGNGFGAQQCYSPQGLAPQPVVATAAAAPSVGSVGGFAPASLWEQNCTSEFDMSQGAVGLYPVQRQ